jgi:hypothetical protein
VPSGPSSAPVHGARRRAPGRRWVLRVEFRAPPTQSIPKIFQNPAIPQFPHGHKGFRLVEGPDCRVYPGYRTRLGVGCARTFSRRSAGRSAKPTASEAGGVIRLSAGKFRACGSRDGADAWAARFWVTWRHRCLRWDYRLST